MNSRLYAIAAVSAVVVAASVLLYAETTVPHSIVASLQPGSATIPEDIASANNGFAVDFYKLVSADSDENIFFSPTSIYVVFSMLYEGARGDSAGQIEAAFGFEPDEQARHNATAHTMSSIARHDPYATLELANSMWLADWLAPHDSYVNTIRGTYLADIERVDFKDSQGSTDRINSWASEKTREKIKKILTPEDVNSLTALVLTNAIYFKGTWVTQFPEENTRESEFWKDGTQSVRTDFMNVVGMFDYTQQDDVQMLRLPYKGDRLSMLVILPADRDGMDPLQETLSAGLIQKWNKDMLQTDVEVSMPKFRMETYYDLTDPLARLGVADVFDPEKADLSGIADVSDENLYVSKSAQKAFVDINEEGTEAAAVTAVVVTTTSAPPPPVPFIADRPFVFIIQDDESGAILFMGRVTDPSPQT